MLTIIFDIDGTLTDMRPLEDPALRAKNPNPTLIAYPAVKFIKDNPIAYNFVFVTGGSLADTTYVLQQFAILDLFDLKNSVSADSNLPPKTTGEPFRQIAQIFPECVIVGDSNNDKTGAFQAGIACLILGSGEVLTDQKLRIAILRQSNKTVNRASLLK